MVLFLLLIIAAVALGIVGVVVNGLLYLLFVGAAVLILSVVLLGVRIRRSGSLAEADDLCWPVTKQPVTSQPRRLTRAENPSEDNKFCSPLSAQSRDGVPA